MTPPPVTPPPESTGRGAAGGRPPRWLLALALVGGPAAWGAHLALSYYLVPRACAAGTSLPLHAVTAGTALLAVAAIAAAWRIRGAGGADDRSGFAATVGLLVGVLFLLALLGGVIPVLFVDPCR